MDKEREIRTIPIGESRKSVIRIESKKDEKKVLLVTPNEVEVWELIKENDERGERKKIEPVKGEVGLYKITKPGVFFVKDLETEEEVPIEVSFNSDNLKQAA